MYIVLIILLIVVLAGGIAPHWGYWGPSGSPYGWGPSGVLGLILVIVLILALFGRL